jgi:hypothetical protein
VEGQSDKEMNFANLRSQKEALEAELAALRPLKTAQTVKEAGFDPDSPAGKALTRLAADSDVEGVKSLAAELGFEVGNIERQPTAVEAAAVAAGDQFASFNQTTTSDEPVDVNGQIAELQAQIHQMRSQGQNTSALVSKMISLETQKAVASTPRA